VRHPDSILRVPLQSNDNPFSEAQFKGLKYWPEFPDRFGAYEDAAETFCQRFFPWYNLEHRHGALGLMTPARHPLRAGRRQWSSSARCSQAQRARHHSTRSW
jgi:hypothetical protein